MRNDWYRVAADAWPILVECARTASPITYGDLARRLGHHHRNMRYVLEVIQAYCLQERLPPLTVLAVNAHSGMPGAGFTAVDRRHADVAMRDAVAFRWSECRNPFAFTTADYGRHELVEVLLSPEVDGTDVWRRVRDKGVAQLLFREALLAAYGGRCAVTGSDLRPLLQAAHIVPWANATEQERLNVRNGLLLHAFIHALFDAGILLVDADMMIHLRPPRGRRGFPEFDRVALASVEGRMIRSPMRPHLAPDPALLARRFGGAGT